MSGQPFMRVVEGSIETTEGNNPQVRLLFDILDYGGKRLAANILNGIDGVTLTHRCDLNSRAFGVGHRYHLAVNGDALRCAAVQNVIIFTIQDNPGKAAEFRELARTK